MRRATAPGRVNLIGDHTDYNRGLALPMAIDLGVTVSLTSGDGPMTVRSDAFPEAARIPDRLGADAATIGAVEPAWARVVAAMMALSPRTTGGRLDITATLPMGAGLSSSAALCVALAELLGDGEDAGEIARRCQRAEQLTGVPVGAMDPMVCAGARAGHALLIDFDSSVLRPVPVPLGCELVVVDSGQRRTVRSSAYATRVSECREAAGVIGPLGLAHPSDLAQLHDPRLRRRARHVVTECGRVRGVVEAFGSGDLVAAGRLLTEGHRSLAGDFEVSTPVVDRLVAHLDGLPGVFGARMTGAGFGGCVVALTRPGALVPEMLANRAWRVEASDGTVARRGHVAARDGDMSPG